MCQRATGSWRWRAPGDTAVPLIHILSVEWLLRHWRKLLCSRPMLIQLLLLLVLLLIFLLVRRWWYDWLLLCVIFWCFGIPYSSRLLWRGCSGSRMLIFFWFPFPFLTFFPIPGASYCYNATSSNGTWPRTSEIFHCEIFRNEQINNIVHEPLNAKQDGTEYWLMRLEMILLAVLLKNLGWFFWMFRGSLRFLVLGLLSPIKTARACARWAKDRSSFALRRFLPDVIQWDIVVARFLLYQFCLVRIMMSVYQVKSNVFFYWPFCDCHCFVAFLNEISAIIIRVLCHHARTPGDHLTA